MHAKNEYGEDEVLGGPCPGDPHNYRIMDFTSEQLIPVAGLTNRRQELPRTEMTAFKYMYVRAPGSRPVSCRTSLKA